MTNGMELYYEKVKLIDFKAEKEIRDKCEHDWEESGNYHGAEVHRCKTCGEVSFGGY